MINTTDREFLTFSNLTNLEWQFTKIKKNDNGKYPILTEVLNPEKFFRKDEENPDIVKYIYSNIELLEGEGLTPEQLEKGLNEMRKKAPVAMNYLEECDKGSKEGDFLKNWEVVGGYDNYKVAEEYLNLNLDISTKILEALQGENFSQEEIEKLYKESIYQQMLDIMANSDNREDFKDLEVNRDMIAMDTEEIKKFFDSYKAEISPKLKKNHETCVENIKKIKDSFPTREQIKDKENKKRNLTLIYNVANHTLNVLLRMDTLKSLKNQDVIKESIDNNKSIINNVNIEKVGIRANYLFKKQQLKDNFDMVKSFCNTY